MIEIITLYPAEITKTSIKFKGEAINVDREIKVCFVYQRIFPEGDGELLQTPYQTINTDGIFEHLVEDLEELKNYKFKAVAKKIIFED